MKKLEIIFAWIVKIGLFIIPFLPLYVSSSMLFPFITGKNFAFRIITEVIFIFWVWLAAAFHHIAVLMPEEIKIEEVINLLKGKNVNFPGNIIGGKDSKLRQIFTQAENVNDHPYTVLELIQRNKDPKTGKIYQGFINEQADDLMKSTVLKT
jgi:hypothetical protein